MSKLAKILSRAADGLRAPLVTVEVHISAGLPSFSIVGLPETAVKESKDRVRSALVNSHFQFPNGRMTVSLAPADLPKSGGRYDLPIALGILLASAQIKPGEELSKIEFYGELGLDGTLRRTVGLLPAMLFAKRAQHAVVIPRFELEQTALLDGLTIYPCRNLLEVCAFLSGQALPEKIDFAAPEAVRYEKDYAQVRGQHHAKRALEIAASGGHNLLMVGPPGSGKTMLAERMPSIMTPMRPEEALEKAAIYSVAGHALRSADLNRRPFRSPHHSSSAAALVGGGKNPRPGEISLAHHGVLFLDELPEFPRHVLEALRQPLESRLVCLSRARTQVTFPANFQLIAAMNPCPCGHLGDGTNRCHCTEDQISRYHRKISGPLLDRVDMILEVPPLAKKILMAADPDDVEPSAAVRLRVERAYHQQMQRQGKNNDMLFPDELAKMNPLSAEESGILEDAIDRFHLSARSYHRILKVARTIADLENSDKIHGAHLVEAIAYKRYQGH